MRVHISNSDAINFRRRTAAGRLLFRHADVANGQIELARDGTTMPPLAVPSSLARTMPVTPEVSVNLRACSRPFCPVVASSTSSTSCGASGITFFAVRPSSAIRPSVSLVCRRPRVHDHVIHLARAGRAEASNSTALGSLPGLCRTTGEPVRSPQISSCSMAAARNVSAAHSMTLRCSLLNGPPACDGGGLTDR